MWSNAMCCSGCQGVSWSAQKVQEGDFYTRSCCNCSGKKNEKGCKGRREGVGVTHVPVLHAVDAVVVVEKLELPHELELQKRKERRLRHGGHIFKGKPWPG